ncbi:MAG: GNAT family N-acetyltransferase [Lysinibacillus sp.]
MLVRYKKALEKIAMGLLSFMPQEKDVKRLMETIQQYEQLDNWLLYLWKKDEEYVGIIGVKIEEEVAIIQHITVVPSYRGEGVAVKMLQELCDLKLFTKVKATEETEPFLQKCMPIIKEG